MATSFSFGGSNSNRKKEVDLIDVAALILVPIAASMIFEVFEFNINVFGGYDFTQAIWTVGGAAISVALLVSVFGIGWIVATNLLNDQTHHTPGEFAAIGIALALPVLYVFVPAVESLVMWHDLMQLASLLYVSAAAVYISYVG